MALSQNGGPLAFLSKQTITVPNIHIFSAYGKHLKTIELKDLYDNENVWVSFNFTSEEDLFLLNSKGTFYFVDAKTGDMLKDK